ncbi:MAG: AAA family ATPase [Polyangiaceae bacterium]
MSVTNPKLEIDLLRRDAYGQLAPKHVALEETHISWVFVLDRDVFKVKKPVDFGFLDFSTIDKRKAACDAEVRLNARLAPHVYRGVVAVRCGEDGCAEIGGAGEIVDWAVHMVRLPNDRRADQLLAHDDLSGEDIDLIAARIAAFHEDARADEETAAFGKINAIRKNLEENFAQARDALDAYVSPENAEEIVRWQTAFVRGHENIFEQRARAGHVRDGHGDLKLEHLYLDAPTPTIIDCIEFNDRFRYADVCADIAFLSMDLAAKGRVDLAERLLAHYARVSNDFDLYALVDFYESYRAFVRGKISAMLANNEAVSWEARAHAAADARHYFLLALAADRRSVILPSVVAVGGIIASGKSTIAEHIGAEMSAPVIDADRTRKAMIGAQAEQPIHDGAWQGAYDPAFSDRVYAEVLRRAGVVLASGRPVVLDASFRSAEMRRAARDLAIAHNVPFRFVECRADREVCRERLTLRARTRSVSDGRLEIFDAFCARFQPISELPSPEHIVIDTSRPLEQNRQMLRSLLETWPRGFVT